ncbi:unnamed protein product [Camellia sinensis]
MEMHQKLQKMAIEIMDENAILNSDRPPESNSTQDLESFMGVKVCKVVRDYRGDYINILSYPYLMNILQIEKRDKIRLVGQPPSLNTTAPAINLPATSTDKRDTITAGNPISSTSDETLISDRKRFELRFLNISGHRYVGIQYYTWRPLEIVLVFNQDNPLPDSATGFFGILNGNLTLWDKSGISYFSTSLGSSRSTAKLLDSRDLVVRDDQSGKSLWESFNNPTNTFLPGMNMNANLKLTSWTERDDPTSGDYIFQQNGDVRNGYIVCKSH